MTTDAERMLRKRILRAEQRVGLGRGENMSSRKLPWTNEQKPASNPLVRVLCRLTLDDTKFLNWIDAGWSFESEIDDPLNPIARSRITFEGAGSYQNAALTALETILGFVFPKPSNNHTRVPLRHKLPRSRKETPFPSEHRLYSRRRACD
jgi:hypothetical protein